MDNKLFYYDEDIKDATNVGFWTGFLCGVTVIAIPAGFVFLFVF